MSNTANVTVANSVIEKELAAQRKARKRASFKDDMALHVMALPGALSTFAFSYLPLYGILLAFKNYSVQKGILGSEWVGLQNFKFLVSQYGWIIIRNTLGYNIIFIVLNLILAVGLALLLNELHSKGLAKVVQTIYIMPYFLAITTVAIVVNCFLSYSHGTLTFLVEKLTGTRPNFYQESKWWPWFFVIINAWKSVGYSAIVYLASITGISKEFYEAAMLDGATKWQQARYITIPQLRTMISILLIMSLGGIFSGDMGLFYSVTQNSTAIYKVSLIMDTYVYYAFREMQDVGMSTAAGVLQSVVGLIFMLLSNKIVTLIEPDNALF